ncbi:MAG TPA: chemoreceptor glutamine deamidase CheD [Steroidobacteraceae bacterium]|nr:chemoreceptor glutamine deamidase CheD [Steroidobacteraceae bacterium]
MGSSILERSAKTPQPPVLRGFEHLQRFWEPDTERWTAKILPGEYYVTCNDEAITTVLGSCISACVRDPHKRIGGMNHFMLPEDASSGHNSWLTPGVGLATRYGSYAMESLVNDLLKLGAARERLEFKLFGGGKILASLTDVGARNIEFIYGFIKIEGYKISAEDLGGTQPRKVVYFPADGRARVRRLRPIENRSIADREQIYMANLSKGQDGGEVELFDQG